MTRALPGLLFVTLTLLGGGLASADAPAQFAAPGVRAPDDPNVSGFRFSLLQGKNTRVRGFDLGVLSLTESERVTWKRTRG